MYAYVKGSVNLEEHMTAFEERKTLWNRLSQVDDITTPLYQFCDLLLLIFCDLYDLHFPTLNVVIMLLIS